LEGVLIYLSDYITKDGGVGSMKHGNTEDWKSHPYTCLDRPVVLQEVDAPRISRQSAHECGKIVSLRDRLPLCPGYIPGIISVRG
jgi:hypothetical protein